MRGHGSQRFLFPNGSPYPRKIEQKIILEAICDLLANQLLANLAHVGPERLYWLKQNELTVVPIQKQ